MATPAERVAPPRRTPRKGGLKSVADFRPNDRLGRAGTLQYDAEVCSPVVGTVQLCYGPDVDAQDKTGDGFLNGAPALPPFGGYVGVECFIHPGNDYEGRARSALELAEGLYLEEQLWTWLAAATNTAATTLKDAVAAAENYADANYIGQPVLHMNRGDVSEVGVLSANPVNDGMLWTPNGTPVVASSAYPAGVVAVSGDITVEHSSIVVKPGNDLTHNTTIAIAERVYGILVDCEFRAKFTAAS
jgi:hypothetical protein